MVADPAPEKFPESVATGPGNASTQRDALPIAKWLKPQWLSALVLAAALSPLGLTATYSSLFGSMAAFLPAVFFAVFAGRKLGASSSVFLQAAVIGEMLKLTLTAVICLVVFKWVDPLAPGWFFAGMILVIMAGWVGLFRGLSSDFDHPGQRAG